MITSLVALCVSSQNLEISGWLYVLTVICDFEILSIARKALT